MDNKLEYIPGDLVMTNGVPLGTAKDVVYRVTSSDPTKTLKLDDGTVLKGVVCLENIEGAEFGDKGYLLCDCCAWVKHIVPIPLTLAILEANGWNHLDNAYGLYTFEHPDEEWLELILEPYGWKAYCLDIGISDFFNSVHQLQHLLFGLGLDYKIKI